MILIQISSSNRISGTSNRRRYETVWIFSTSSRLAGQIGEGDIIVAGSNFGCGSSREQAPEIIKALKVKCVIAKSFARIFFRNSINNGLLLIENDKIQDAVKEGDEIEVTLGEKITYNGTDYEIHSLPDNLMEIINAGGLVEAMKKRNGVK